QLNLLDAGLTERQQKALDILLDTFELKAETNGAVDYTGQSGKAALYQAAVNFCGDGSPLVTRHGDLRAAHLAINFNNAQAKLHKAGMPPLPVDVNSLVNMCADIASLPPRTEDRMGLFLSYFQKQKLF